MVDADKLLTILARQHVRWVAAMPDPDYENALLALAPLPSN